VKKDRGPTNPTSLRHGRITNKKELPPPSSSQPHIQVVPP
jgi:hypothetical protein